MLRRVLQTFDAQWDRALPYLMIAYREVPQETTGFSPYELLYRRQPRGPLDILKESWEQQETTPESVVGFMQKMQTRLTETREIVRENEEAAKRTQKRWYDRTARERVFQEGDTVLVLLPSVSNKLLVKWQGPYPVIRKLSDTTYQVRMEDKRNKVKVFHVNMLAKWKSPSAVCLSVDHKGAEMEEEMHPAEDIPTWIEPDNEQGPEMVTELSSQKQTEMTNLLQTFGSVFSDIPSRTDRARIKIETGDAPPVHPIDYHTRDTRRCRQRSGSCWRLASSNPPAALGHPP